MRIFDSKRGRRLVAAVEIVSPANKNRPEHRRMFVAKCAAISQQRVAVSIVDLVIVRAFNLYADLLESWQYPLRVGQPLPTLPLWLTDTFAVPLKLEGSDEQTGRDLCIS